MQAKAKQGPKPVALDVEHTHLNDEDLAGLVAAGRVDPQALRTATREASEAERLHYAEVWNLRQQLYGQLDLIDACLNRFTKRVNAERMQRHAAKTSALASELCVLLAPESSKPKRKAS